MKERLPFHALPEKQKRRRVMLRSFTEYAALPFSLLGIVGAVSALVTGDVSHLVVALEAGAVVSPIHGVFGLTINHQREVRSYMERRSIEKSVKKWVKEEQRG